MDTSMTVLDAMILTGFRGGKKEWNQDYNKHISCAIQLLDTERNDYFVRRFGRKSNFRKFVTEMVGG